MNNTEFFSCFETTMNEVVKLVRSATRTIYYSTFICSVTHQLPGQPAGVTLKQLFTDALARGVSIFILYNPSTSYGNIQAGQFLAELTPQTTRPHNQGIENNVTTGELQLKTVTGSGQLGPLATFVSSHKFYSNHHQKYLCVDGKRILVTGCDISAERNGWLKLNSMGYYWHEFSVSAPCTAEMYLYIQSNFHDGICTTPAPLPLTASGTHNSEQAIILDMIKNCKEFMHIEAQTCTSTQFTKNTIFTAIIQRVKQAYHHKELDPFKCLVLTNDKMIGETALVRWASEQDVMWSRRYLKAGLESIGVPWNFVCDRVFMGKLQHNNINIKIHSNVFIQDGNVLLRTSSNLNDRSFSNKPCDTELGILVTGPEVSRFQSLQLARYLGKPFETSADFFVALQATTHAPQVDSACLIKPIRLSATKEERTRVPNSIVNYIMKTTHKGNFHGGIDVIVWTLTKIKTKKEVVLFKYTKPLVMVCTLFLILAVVAFIYKRRQIGNSSFLLTKTQS